MQGGESRGYKEEQTDIILSSRGRRKELDIDRSAGDDFRRVSRATELFIHLFIYIDNNVASTLDRVGDGR